MTMELKEIYSESVETLRKGVLLLDPTDTVWGRGCDATDPEAVARGDALKRRSDSKSLVLLADGLDMIARYVKEIPEMAVQLVEVNDRPMTIIYPGAVAGVRPAEGEKPLKDKRALAYNTVAEDGSVGIRIPMSDFCRELVRRFGRPVVSTSANISGMPAPRGFGDIPDEIKSGVDYIVDPCYEGEATGKASSIILLGEGGEVKIIRE